MTPDSSVYTVHVILQNLFQFSTGRLYDLPVEEYMTQIFLNTTLGSKGRQFQDESHLLEYQEGSGCKGAHYRAW